jgi:GDP-L-fucose synthase
VVSGSGKPLRQFIYSRDLAKLMIWTLRSYEENTPLILSPAADEEISIKQVADTIVKTIGFDLHLLWSLPRHHEYAQLIPLLSQFDSTKADGQYRKPASNEKLLSKIGTFEFTPFQEALEQSINWLVANWR